jgi:chromosome segregation ATPase
MIFPIRPRDFEASPRLLACAAVALVLVLLLAGCAGPKQFTAPDARPLLEAHKELAEKVTQAKAKIASAAKHIEAAETHQKAATVSHSQENVKLGEIGPVLLKLRSQITDVVLREEVDALSAQVTQTQALAVETDKEIAATGIELSTAREDNGAGAVLLTQAEAKAAELKNHTGPDYVAKAEKTIGDANKVIVTTAAKVDREAKAKRIWFSAFTLTAVGFAAFAYFKR